MFEQVALLEPQTPPHFPRLDPDAPPTLLIVTDDFHLATTLEVICDFLGLGVEQVSTSRDVAPLLRAFAPIAVVAAAEGDGQDGFNVMMGVADLDRGLPIMFLTGNDPALIGAADAVEEVWGLTAVTKTPNLPTVGEIVDFLFRAGRRGGWFRAIHA